MRRALLFSALAAVLAFAAAFAIVRLAGQVRDTRAGIPVSGDDRPLKEEVFDLRQR
ncbi:MAG: hypothetical protein IH851_02050 [Armatimonadetes bacterium]|nr:hypothetical protein [Armatimonadota bacterium]